MIPLKLFHNHYAYLHLYLNVDIYFNLLKMSVGKTHAEFAGLT